MEAIAGRNLGNSSKQAQKLVDQINKDEAIAKAKAEAKRIADEKAKAEAARIEAERVVAEKAAQEAARVAEEARQAEIARQQAEAVRVAPKAVSSYSPGDNEAMNYIFMKESSNNPGAVNAGGCIGLGQSCPGGSGLANDCPNWRNDVPCQIAHFTKYANNRYGGWGGAYNFWLNNHWW